MLKFRNWDAAAGSAAPPLEGHGPEGAERATFAAGCFWGVEAAFRQIHGVLHAERRVRARVGGVARSPSVISVRGALHALARRLAG